MTKRALPLAQLLEDMSVYPRHTVDDVYVNQLAEALRAGVVLPLVVAEASSKRIVDGWHRVRAYRKVLGAEGVIDVDLRAYKTEADLLLEAIHLNASHGRKFDRIDQVRSVLMAQEAGVAADRIAIALNVTPARVETLRIRIAYAQAPAGAGGDDGEGDGATQTIKIALKRPMLHFTGQAMTPEQAAAHDGQAGTSYLLQVRQVQKALRYELMNRDDERLMAALAELQAELDRYLAP